MEAVRAMTALVKCPLLYVGKSVNAIEGKVGIPIRGDEKGPWYIIS